MVEWSDGWTIYIWLISGVAILIAVVFGLRWASKNEQFDEDIKYLVFDDNDRDKMSPEEFKKYQEATAKQENRRSELLNQAHEGSK
ncbi:hypothetical protein D8Y20_06390 [Mariprofundus sp. EBB-1]|uniref:hypothetical protein n=1 Tax=Mariprofundus sp. EBB-1 TaxID=2650971 RepID=UPI000EF21E91|nr:hypothetical protein [Mariprofundus sp. EBB-1]RLL52872.1 hypothetical protein D8Y20_06390 [Mariprofundus sp. EBB-1]